MIFSVVPASSAEEEERWKERGEAGNIEQNKTQMKTYE